MTAVAALLAACIGAGPAHADPLDDAMAALVRRDFSTALTLFRPLAEQGNPIAQRSLGVIYNNVYAKEWTDQRQAALWLGKAAAGGDAIAQCRLGKMYLNASGGLPHDVSQGLFWMKLAASHGERECAVNLWQYYHHGMLGVPQDDAQGLVWIRKAAELGDAAAEDYVAALYEKGWGVEQDIAQANVWYRNSVDQIREKAERGDAVAQVDLAGRYEFGVKGVTQDKGTALFWYRRAASPDSPARKIAEMAIARLGAEGTTDAHRGGQ